MTKLNYTNQLNFLIPQARGLFPKPISWLHIAAFGKKVSSSFKKIRAFKLRMLLLRAKSKLGKRKKIVMLDYF